MGYNVGSGNGNTTSNNLFLMRAQSERDRQSGCSCQARDMMEGMNPMQILGQIMQIMQMLGSISG